MTRIFLSGFETGNFDEWTTVVTYIGAVVEVTSSLSHSGTYSCLHNDTFGSWVQKTFNVGLPVIYGSFWFRWRHYVDYPWGESFFGTNMIFWLKGPSNTQISFGWPSYLGRLDIYRGNAYDTGGVLLGITPQWLLSSSVWHLIEFRIVIDNIFGEVQVRIDGASPYAIDLIGVNTQGDTTAKTVNTICTGFYWRPNSFIWGYWDDVVIDDSNWPGASKIVRLPINNNGAINQWTPSTGLNYQCVDEIVRSETDYISTQVLENIDLFATSDLVPGAPCNINSIQSIVYAWKDGKDDANILPALRAGVTVYEYTSASLGYSPLNTTRILETNPITHSAFSLEDINNLQFGAVFSRRADYSAYLNVASLSIGWAAVNLNDGINNNNYIITTGGDYIPTADTTVYYETFFDQLVPCSVKLGNPGVNSTSWFSFPVTGPKTVTFWQAVDSETGWDWLSFYIDDILQPGRISGPNNPAVWNQISASITSGTHTLKWVFKTDAGSNPGRSAGWVTGVVIS